MFDLRTMNGSVWLMDPPQLRREAVRVANMPCFDKRAVAIARQDAMDNARQMTARALLSMGADDDFERSLAADGPTKAIRAVKGKVGVIGVYGPVQQRMTSELMKSGGTSLEEVSLALDMGLADKSIGAIVFDVASPGGSSSGVEELANKIYASRAVKPSYCMVNAQCGSAALWAFSAATMTICTPSGYIGSVGAYAMHVDESAALEKEGYRVTIISSGDYKAELSSTKPLSEEAMAYVQKDINGLHDKFVMGMKRNRNTTADDVRQNYGKGRMLNADDALRVGLIDRILSFEDLLRKLTGQTSDAGGGNRADAEKVRFQIRHENTMRKLRSA